MSQPKHFGVVEIDPQGDLLIEVVEYDYEACGGTSKRSVVATATFKISRGKLLSKECAANIRTQLQDTRCTSITVDKYSVGGVELWLRCFHGALTLGCDVLSIKDVWNAIAFARESGFDMNELKGWSESYLSHVDWHDLDIDDLRQLLYPCYAFNNPKYFAKVSRALSMQGIGHVTEISATPRFMALHVPGQVINQINAAKGSMRTRILQSLFKPTEPTKFCAKNCPARDHCIVAYLEGVQRTKIWPLHLAHTRSIQCIIDSDGFLEWQCRKPDSACKYCEMQLRGNHVGEIRENTIKYWDGLCLDCMDLSQPKTGNIHTDYWKHDGIGNWSRGCRITHSRNTWYHSFMGRPDLMDKYQKEQNERNNKARGRRY